MNFKLKYSLKLNMGNISFGIMKLLAEQGMVNAQCTMGKIYHQGEEVEQDYKEAIKWFRMAAEQGHDIAQYNFGVCYAKGEGVEKDNKEAEKWFKKAANQGYTKAQSVLDKYYKKMEWLVNIEEVQEIGIAKEVRSFLDKYFPKKRNVQEIGIAREN